jgi:multiple sugar transport system ATP-binding protein
VPRVEFRQISKVYVDGTKAVVDLDLDVEDGEFLCILGPSGCGKSSTLRMLAGLEGISSGDLLLDGQRINDRPAQDRDMAMVFENYALYPHLRVFDNIAMPLRARRRPRAEVRARVGQVAETLQITDLLGKFPHALSGGQRQRVALGRAIVRTPRMFLMDEPLGHLEAYLRVQLRTEVRRLHERHGVTTVYITHDQDEAAAVSDRIAVMNAGRLQQIGSLLDLMDRPVNRFVAEFIGDLPINVLPAEQAADAVSVGQTTLPLSPTRSARLPAGALALGVRPQDVHLVDDGETALAARVVLLEPQGDRSVLIAETQVGRVSALVRSKGAPQPGEMVRLRLDLSRVHLFAPDGAVVPHRVAESPRGG